MAKPKSLMEFICAAIDEALPSTAEVTGRDLYMRGFERWQEANWEKQRKQARRELEASAPPPSTTQSEVIADAPLLDYGIVGAAAPDRTA